ncbi:MAG: choice-of-anchor D domain-containing protein [Candidatus Kapabacteria bacterium]|nr:choice-of-anchor D domain-containing protein [Candidatus Kapabacteria bacterium]
MIHPLLILFCLFTGYAVGFAQPRVEVYHKNSDRLDTVMDFGVTLEGSPTTRTFTVENKGAATVAIYETNPNADPYYLIINVPGVPPEDPRKEEFESGQRLPYYVGAGKSVSFPVVFRALVNNPLFPPDRVVEALLKLRVVDSAAPTSASFDRTFRLRALKTTKILASTNPWIAYDSVYINPQPLTPTLPYTIDNAISRRVKVDRQLLEMQTAVVGVPEIEVDTFPSVEFSPEDSVVWNTRYKPYNRGLDSAHFLVVYRPDVSARPDTVLATISGFGVEQRLTLIGATGTPLPVVVRGDTVDFGSTPADGQGITARIVVRNEGNVNIGLLSEGKVGTQRDTSAFVIRQSLLSDGPTIRAGTFDTLEVSFVPVDGGDHRMRLVVNTDLLQRGITGVPDGAQTTQWFFKGFGQRPQIQVTPSALDFGTVVLLETCVSTVERTFTVRNVGNAELRVDSTRVSPSTVRLTVDPASFRIAPGSSQLVRCIYQPEFVGSYSGAITLFTNSLIRAYDVSYGAVVVEPDSISIGIPLLTTARPGSPVGLDVAVTPEAVKTVDRCVLSLTYNPSLLRYRGVLQAGSASEGAQVVDATEEPLGALRLGIQAPSNFLEKPLLITVLFDSFLGESASTDVAFTYKTVSGGARFSVGVFPNPALDDATITIVVPQEREVGVGLFDSFGRQYDSIETRRYSAGMHLVPLNVRELPPSVYTLVVRSGHVFSTIQFVVGR